MISAQRAISRLRAADVMCSSGLPSDAMSKPGFCQHACGIPSQAADHSGDGSKGPDADRRVARRRRCGLRRRSGAKGSALVSIGTCTGCRSCSERHGLTLVKLRGFALPEIVEETVRVFKELPRPFHEN